ncbi:MAG: hypothetical protein P8R42_26655 [Candidatus Binatia bacterium]|nr:hypothetical protein [Candidatus Binatia bacterium]
MHRARLLLALLQVFLGAAVATAAPRYDIAASLEPDAGVIEGTVRIRFERSDDVALLHLYPNRFRKEGPEVDDTTRRYVYPRGIFHPGGITVEGVQLASGEALPHRLDRPQGSDEETLLEIDLPAGGLTSVEIVVAFRTDVPKRFGPFGVTEQGFAAVGGWHPYLVARDDNGGWHPDWAPPPANVDANVQAPSDRALVLGDAVFPAGHGGSVRTTHALVRNLALLAPLDADIAESVRGDTKIRFIEPHEPRAYRLGPDPEPDTRFQTLVLHAFDHRPNTLTAPDALTVAQIPLRWNLTSQSDAPIVISDRAMHVQDVLSGFHGAQIAQAVYAALLQPRMMECEPPGQRNWIQQGVAWYLADRFLAATDPDHQSVHDWIRYLDFLAIVDRFESAPKIPFVEAFFENSLTDDELRESVFSYARVAPPARLSFARLDRSVGEEPLTSAIETYLGRLDGPCVTFAETLQASTPQQPSRVREELESARVPVVPDGPRARIDPNLRPRRERSKYQFILDSADIDVSSSQFGFGALFLLRKRSDYTKDIVFAPYFSERSYGLRTGPRFHFGSRNDPNNYRHNVLLFYQISGLVSGFKDDSRPDVRSTGGIGGFGIRYDYSNVYWFNNPTEKRNLRLFVDGYDSALGGDYSFLRYGARLRGTTKIFSPNTLAALELLGGFEQDFSASGVPIQEQYALGGQRAIRGISINQELARNIGLARFELRQAVYPEFDLNLLDFLTYRRPQVRLFLDAGNVDDAAGRAVNPANWAIGGGVGVSLLYDFMGFFPGSAYLELATRLDRDQQDIQVLFGTRQAF